jgi:hypothetical protein
MRASLNRLIFVTVALLATLAMALPATALPAAAQQRDRDRDASPVVSPTDIQRLQDLAYDAGRDVQQLRQRGDATFANRLDDELTDLRDEVIYLKVKVRKEGRVSRGEYADLRDRLEDLRARARGDIAQPSNSGRYPSQQPPSPAPRPEPAPAPPPPVERDAPRDTRYGGHMIPVGQELDVRLQTPLSSNTAQVEDRFNATTLVDVTRGNELLIPAGALVRGVVRSVHPAGRLDRKGSMTLSFDQITIEGRSYPIRATVTQAIESEGVKGEAGKIGAGAGVGAIIGGILGGFKGALAGILIGGGGTIAATEGTDVKLDPGTILRIRFDSSLDLDSPPSAQR